MLPRFFCLVCSFLMVAQACTAAADKPALARGINLSSWLANVPRQPLYARDFILIKQAGFDNVRLPVDPERLGFKLTPDFAVSDVDFLPLDRAITLAISNGLAVVLDVHPSDAFVQTLQEKKWARKKFAELWVVLAKRYREYPVHALAFELLNEPQYYGAEKSYNEWIRTLAATVRKADRKRFLIVGAPLGSSIDGLQQMEPLNDARVIYDFHFYEPYIFTHQGTAWGFEKQMLRYFHGLPYPASKVKYDAKVYTPESPNPSQAQSELKDYVDAKWDATRIAARINVAKEWAVHNKAEVICGEFGVLRAHSDPASRYRWIGDARRALEADGIGWELWDYADGFGIVQMHGKTVTDPADASVRFVDPAHGSRTFEPEALKALGLR